MLFIIFRHITFISAIFLLSGCLGGSIATQIVSTIATRMADRAIANAMDVQDGPSHRKQTNTYNSYASNPAGNSAGNSAGNLADNKFSNNKFNSNNGLSKNNALNNTPNTTPSDQYQTAITNMAFEQTKPAPETSLNQASPLQIEETEMRIAIIEGNQLVRVELFNLLIGDEKNAVFEKARLLGASSLPQKREWQRWGVGTGAFKQDGQSDKKIITFLIPPEFGKLPSGSIAMVELASPGELNVARYKGN